MIIPIENDLLSTKVFNALKEAMIDGRLWPGEKTTETKLAEMLGVSRTPVREALKLLSAQGFVTLVKNSGVVINEFTLDDYKQELEARSVLEGLAASLAAQNITDEQAERLKEAYQDIAKLCVFGAEHNGWDFVPPDMAFHRVINEIAGNSRLRSIENPMQGRLEWLLANVISASEMAVEFSYTHHKRILDAILARDPQKAEQIAREHPLFMMRLVDSIDREEFLKLYKDLIDGVLARSPEKAASFVEDYPNFIFRILDSIDHTAFRERQKEKEGRDGQ